MPFHHLPDVEKCCACVPDLRIASAIIAVLGIVTSPSVSWAMVRHSYSIHVSCFITFGAGRPDIVDINLHNMLTFGFGPNAGMGPSCLMRDRMNKTILEYQYTPSDLKTGAGVGIAVKAFGWLALAADLIFVICCIHFVISIFKGGEQFAARIFMVSASISMLISFLFGVCYLSVCVFAGGAFPLFEVVFTFVDLFLWLYFLIVVNSYRRRLGHHGDDVPPLRRNLKLESR